jgi:predicted transcriptional regulator of viral defense system
MKLQSEVEQAGISKKERLLIDSAFVAGKTIIKMEDVMGILDISKQQSSLMLSRLTRKGWLQRLKAGIYLIVPLGSDSGNPIPEDAWAIAMEIFSPGYIGGWTAAEYWDLTEQIFNETVFYTSRPQRKADHDIAGLQFRTKSVQPAHIFGTSKIWQNNKLIFISDLHKTFIDILGDPSMGGGGRAMIDMSRAYAKKKEADFERLWQYAVQLDHGAVFKRLGLIAEKIMKIPGDQLQKIKDKTKSGILLLDPVGPAKGPVSANWGIRVNIPIDDLA